MLPKTLVSVYQQYKDDTNAVASWLASSAKACGYSADLLTSQASQQSQQPTHSKRLKGKARAAAKTSKNAGNGTQQTAAGRSGPKYIIAIKDFIPLAEYIAASRKPLISVPLVFLNTLNRVISARSRFPGLLSTHGAEVDLDSDSRHSYFTGILDKVLETLRPRTSPSTQDAAQAARGESSALLTDLGSRFAQLHVYEPSEEFLNAPAIERPTPVKADNATYEAEPETTLEDAIFAYMLMLEDLKKLRMQVEWIWTQYRDGLLDLAVAAVATNTACDLARNMTEEFVPIFAPHGGAVGVANKFYLMQCLLDGHSLASITNPPIDDFNHDTYYVANATFMMPFIMLKSFLLVLKPKGVPLYSEGTFGVYDPSRDLSTMSNREKFWQEKIVLSEIFTELMTATRAVEGFLVEDEFLRGMKELGETREVPMSLAFTAQMFLDIHLILRDRVGQAHATCFAQLGAMEENLRLHLDFHKDLKIDHWPRENDMAIIQMIRHIQWMKKDPVHEARVKLHAAAGSPSTTPKHRITQYSPVISGLMLYHFRARTYELGMTVMNAWGSLACPMHLYAAMMQEKLIATPDTNPSDHWRDMDIVLRIKGLLTFFVGGEMPKTPEGYLNKFSLQMGTTASAMIGNRRQHHRPQSALHSRAGPRGIKVDLPVSSMFNDRYVQRTGQIDWTPEHVDDVVSRSLHRAEWSEEIGVGATASTSRPVQKKQAKKTADGSQIPPETLVKALALALQAETLEMAFPYLTLHRSSWTTLRALHEACDPVLRELFSHKYYQKESQLPWMVGWIFMAASEGDKRPLREAAATLKARIAAGDGERAVQELVQLGFDVPTDDNH